MAFLSPIAPLPHLLPARQRATMSRTRAVPRASAGVSRRRALQLAGGALAGGLTLWGNWAAEALSMDEERVTKALATLQEARDRAATLRDDAMKWRETAVVDDAEGVLRVSAVWFEPARKQLAALGDLPARVELGERDAVRTRAALLQGHLLELGQEVDARRSKGVVRELDEFVETVDDVLKLPALQRFFRD